jgi:hypothetical protein
VYVAAKSIGRLLIWHEGSTSPTRTIAGDFTGTCSVFVTTSGDIYIDNGSNGRVDKWLSNGADSFRVMTVSAACYGLFVDTNNTLYCSIRDHHKVVAVFRHGSASAPITVAGKNNAPGSALNRLNKPEGIFVDINFTLYVADWENGRIQKIQLGNIKAQTVVGNGAPSTFRLYGPTGIVLDADNYYFIVDWSGNRIIGQGPNGFRCLVGCSDSSGLSSNQLNQPWILSFDSYGNIFVTDSDNNRIQKFTLERYSYGKLD